MSGGWWHRPPACGAPGTGTGDSGVPEPAGSRSRRCARREGSVVLRYDALFAAEQLPGPGLDELLENALGSVRAVGTVSVLRHGALGESGLGAAGRVGDTLGTRGDTAAPRPCSAAAGPLRSALRLPVRLRLRAQGGRERDLHLALPP